jgi:hypothetical protein
MLVLMFSSKVEVLIICLKTAWADSQGDSCPESTL